jgi:hypothetical protein
MQIKVAFSVTLRDTWKSECRHVCILLYFSGKRISLNGFWTRSLNCIFGRKTKNSGYKFKTDKRKRDWNLFFVLFFKETAKLNFTSKPFIFQRKNLRMCLCKIRLDDLFPPIFLFSQRNRDQNSTVNLKEPKRFFSAEIVLKGYHGK